MSGIRTTGELRSLTSLRGLAAMAVVLQHFSATAQSYCRVEIPSLVPHGYVAVDLFFVLSGFIMAYTYLDGFDRLGLRAFGPFLANRVARIMPLNITVVVGIVLVGMVCQAVLGTPVVHDSRTPGVDLVTNLLLLQGMGIGTNLNGPSWSISVEFAAYLLFPAFIAAVFGAVWSRHLVVVAAVAALCGLALSSPQMAMTADGPPESLVRCFAGFALGLASYSLYRSERFGAALRQDWVTIGLSLAAAASLVFENDLPAVLLFPFIVVAYALNNGRAARFMQFPPFHWLGQVSFALYLLHNPFRPLELLLLRSASPEPVGAAAALAFAAAGACSVLPFAWLAYVAVERPGRAMFRRLLGGSKRSVQQQAVAPP